MQEVLTRAALFQGVAPDTVSELISPLQPIRFPAGRNVFHEGDPGNELYIIIDGKVKIGRHSPDGRDNLLAIMGPADMFGELALFDPGPRTSTVTTLTDLQALAVDRSALTRWIRGHPEIAEQLLRVLARRLRRTNDVLCDIIFTDVPGRVAGQLLYLGQRFGRREGDALRVAHDLTQTELAQLVGSSRETVNKALGMFAERGWIRVTGKTILLVEPAQLARRAQQ